MNWYKNNNYKIAGNPRYKGQLQGDEYRPSSQSFEESLLDSEIIEGEYIKKLRNMAQNKNFKGMNIYLDKLRAEGHKENRLQSMLSKAMYGIKL